MSSYAIFLGVLPVVLDLGFSVLGAVLLTSPSTLLVDRRVSKTRVDGRSSPRSAQGQGEVRVFDLPLAALEPFHVHSFRWRVKALPLLLLWPRLQSRTMRAQRNRDFYGSKSGHPYPGVAHRLLC